MNRIPIQNNRTNEPKPARTEKPETKILGVNPTDQGSIAFCIQLGHVSVITVPNVPTQTEYQGLFIYPVMHGKISNLATSGIPGDSVKASPVKVKDDIAA